MKTHELDAEASFTDGLKDQGSIHIKECKSACFTYETAFQRHPVK